MRRGPTALTRECLPVLAVDLLVLDDFGLQPISPHGAQDLYQVLTERYEHRSMIITSNRAFEEWADVFGDAVLASAALDCLTHHAHALIIRGQSYRQRGRRKEIPGTSLFADLGPVGRRFPTAHLTR